MELCEWQERADKSTSGDMVYNILKDWENERVKVLDLIVQYGGIDGDHHKAWVLDQIVRILTGRNYKKFVADACNGEDGPNTYSWDIGIAP